MCLFLLTSLCGNPNSNLSISSVVRVVNGQFIKDVETWYELGTVVHDVK